MFSPWLWGIFGITMALIFTIPITNRSVSPLSRYSRMTLMHQIFVVRNTILPFLNPRPPGMDADSKGLDELVGLYYPRMTLTDNLTNHEVVSLRHHANQMLTGLHPVRSPSCLVQHHLFKYDDNPVDMYVIQHNQIDDWKNSYKPFVLYFHGGGFVFGGIETYSGFECHLSKELNMLVLHVDFGLSPEYSLANTLEDVIGVYRVLLDVDPNIHQRLIGMGDSSGGMLWIHLLQWIVSNNKSVPQGVVLHSPWPSLQFDYIDRSLRTNVYLSYYLAFGVRQLAIGRDTDWDELTDEEQRKLSPKENAFEGFPPLYITAGTNEVFIEEIRTMIDNAKLAGVKVTFEEGVGLMHTYALFHLWSSKARCVQEKMRRWIQEQLIAPLILSPSRERRRFELYC